jgi:hypothetical protein
MKTKRLQASLSAAVLATLVGVGCSTSPTRYAETFSPAVIERAPIDQLHRRPDTHPELRTGLFQVGFKNQYSVVESPEADLPAAYRGVDTAALLPYNPIVIHVAEASGDAIIVEAAGAPRRAADDLEAYAAELRQQAQNMERQADSFRRTEELPPRFDD